MSTEAISPLRQRMIEDMNSRKLGAHTQRSHIYSCKRFAAFLERSPDTATLEDIRLFQLHLAETGMSICNRNRIMTDKNPETGTEFNQFRSPSSCGDRSGLSGLARCELPVLISIVLVVFMALAGFLIVRCSTPLSK